MRNAKHVLVLITMQCLRCLTRVNNFALNSRQNAMPGEPVDVPELPERDERVIEVYPFTASPTPAEMPSPLPSSPRSLNLLADAHGNGALDEILGAELNVLVPFRGS